MSDREKVRILLVDDQPARLLSYEAILGDLGHELVRAASGHEALQLLMEGDFALVLLDVNMPVMNGFETAELIHKHPRFEMTPIIFVTAFHLSELDRLKAYELGAVDYVFIPVIPAILRSKVAVLVELYCKRRELQQLNEALQLANQDLDVSNRMLQAERTRELERFTHTLEQANAELAEANDVLRAEADVRRQVENALRSSESRLRAILQNTSALIYQIDLEGRFVHVNRMFEQVCGRTNEQLAGKLVRDVFPGEASAAMEANNRRVLEQGHAIEFEETLELDGTTYVFTSIKAPLRDEAERLTGIVGVSTDVTERKRLVEALKQSDRRKDEFLAVLAHELRNPLAPIVNAVELMRRKRTQDEELVWCQDVIGRQAKHLTRLVEDLVDVSRIACGKINLQREPIAIADVVARAIETTRPTLDARRQQLLVDVPAEPPVVHGDPIRLAQVVANLLSNAARFTDVERRIWLTVSCDPEAREVVLRVADEGVGIAADLLPQVFEMFIQGEQTLERSHGGLGVGLALVRRLVDLHGGSVTAHSAGAGQGAEFVVRLPLFADGCGAPSNGQSAPGPAQARGRRILIVDDNVDLASSLCLLLESQGNRVRMAHDGPAGLSLAQSFRPEVALVDIGMPGMNGCEVARRIREQPWGKDVVLIAVTGWSQEEVRARTKEASFDVHMVKPLEVEALEELLGKLAQNGERGPLVPAATDLRAPPADAPG